MVMTAALCSALIIAYQVAAKSAREALFLSTYRITSLPAMSIGAAVCGILLLLFVSRRMRAAGPARLLPWIFWISGALHGMEWLLVSRFKPAVAVMFYLQYAGLGALLISCFWSLVNECFDPHTAKQHIGRIVGAGTLGAICGGLLAERVAAIWSASALLPMLAAMHFLAGWGVTRMRPPARATSGQTSGGLTEGLRVLGRLPYLQHLALLTFLGSVGASMLDYVFKGQVKQAAASSPEMIQRLCAMVYTGVSLVGFAIQAAFTRVALQKAGLGATVSALPAVVTLGSLSAWLFPGLASATAARGSEMVVRSSLFRSAYELFYTPVLPDEKRASKQLVDVGLDRLGELLGFAAIRCMLWLPAGGARGAMLGTSAAAGLLGLWCARRLDRGYVGTLERSLRNRAVELDLTRIEDKTTYTTIVRVLHPASPYQSKAHAPEADPTLRRIADLRSGHANRIRKALHESLLTPEFAAHAIPLMGRDDIAGDVLDALRHAAPGIAGQLVDALLDPAQDFAVRRRIPQVLSGLDSRLAAEGLTLGLEDKRFEVRFRCAKALRAVLESNPELAVPEAVVFNTIARELELDRLVWESHRLLDGGEADELEGRASRGLQYVFTLLSLILPREPVRIAFRALHTGDALLRGTALEYLDSVLPRPIQQRLSPFLDDQRPVRHPGRSREEILAELLRSHESIELRLAELRTTAAGRS